MPDGTLMSEARFPGNRENAGKNGVVDRDCFRGLVRQQTRRQRSRTARGEIEERTARSRLLGI